jgi:two-component system, LytTR family, response regulator
MTTLHVLLADDEPIARRRIVRFLRAEAGVDIVAECATGAEALFALQEKRVDVAILDVQLPDKDGLRVVAEFGAERMPAVIFVTAYDEYAVRAFEVQALDYLLKPVTAERFHAAFQRARTHLDRALASQRGERLTALLAELVNTDGDLSPAQARAVVQPATQHAERLTVKADGRVYFVKSDAVDWVAAEGNYVRVHTGTTSHLIRETISAVEAQLDPTVFCRIHRSTIVNLDRIREMQAWFAGDYMIILKDGAKLKLSRTYRNRLQARLRTVL